MEYYDDNNRAVVISEAELIRRLYASDESVVYGNISSVDIGDRDALLAAMRAFAGTLEWVPRFEPDDEQLAYEMTLILHSKGLDCVTLRGVRVTARLVALIVSQLNERTDSLILWWCEMTDELIQPIIAALPRCTNLGHFSLQRSSVCTQMGPLIEALLRLPRLAYVSIHSDTIDDFLDSSPLAPRMQELLDRAETTRVRDHQNSSKNNAVCYI